MSGPGQRPNNDSPADATSETGVPPGVVSLGAGAQPPWRSGEAAPAAEQSLELGPGLWPRRLYDDAVDLQQDAALLGTRAAEVPPRPGEAAFVEASGLKGRSEPAISVRTGHDWRMDHVLIRRLEHLTGSSSAPSMRFGVETRDRPGPLHKNGAFADDRVWVQLHGGLFVARAAVRISWVGEYSDVASVRARTRGASIHDVEGFWQHRPRFGYAGVATLERESWIEPFWAGPRTYGTSGSCWTTRRSRRAGWIRRIRRAAGRACGTSSPRGSALADTRSCTSRR